MYYFVTRDNRKRNRTIKFNFLRELVDRLIIIMRPSTFSLKLELWQVQESIVEAMIFVVLCYKLRRSAWR